MHGRREGGIQKRIDRRKKGRGNRKLEEERGECGEGGRTTHLSVRVSSSSMPGIGKERYTTQIFCSRSSNVFSILVKAHFMG